MSEHSQEHTGQEQAGREVTSDPNVSRLGVRALYRQSLKPADSIFNLYFARPLAAPLVYLLARTRVTPNQVTFASTFVMIIAVGCLAIIGGPLGVILGVVGVELSYILDCVDGQLARVTGRTSEVGGELDFMMDELKAYLLIVAIGARGAWVDSTWVDSTWVNSAAWFGAPEGAWSSIWPLAVSLAALLCTASAMTLTHFVRSERYAMATNRPRQTHGQSAGEGKRGGPFWPIKSALRLITQYPTSLPIFALCGALDLFLYAYGAIHALYAGVTALGVMLQLGRSAPIDQSGDVPLRDTALGDLSRKSQQSQPRAAREEKP